MGHRKPWSLWETGDRVDVVIQVLFRDDHVGPHCCTLVGIGEVIQVTGHCLVAGAIFTLGNAEFRSGTAYELLIDEHTMVWQHEVATKQQIFSCLEVCAGGGFSSEGIESAGFSCLGGIEQNPRFADIFALAHHVPFVCCDVGSQEALEAAFALSACGGVIMAGINCQPYSVAGDQKKEHDGRAQSLPKTLQLAWLVQANAVVLECTPAALSDPFVQSCIRDFATMANMHITQKVLKLSNCWASKRDRWWAILSRKVFGQLTVDDLPMMPQFQQVSSIMPYIRHWPNTDLEQLVLSLYEHGKFMDYGGGLAQHFLQMNGVMATALHAWGNQCYPCRCGCRAGFSEKRLQSRGLHGQLIPSSDTLVRAGESFPCCRHLHPIEVCLLCGSNPARNVGNDLRLALAAAGQMASPVQAVWIFSHLRRLVLESFGHGPVVTPLEALISWQSKILTARDELWPNYPSKGLVPTRTAPMFPQDVKQQASISLRSVDGVDLGEVRFNQPTTIAGLAQAEASLGHFALDELKFWDVQGQSLSLSADICDRMVVVVGRKHEVPWFLKNEPGHQQTPLPALCDEDFSYEGHFHVTANGEEKVQELTPPTHGAVLSMDSETGSIKGEVRQTCAADQVDSSQAELKGQGDFEDPLCQLSAACLLQLMEPQVLTPGALSGLRCQVVSASNRKVILRHQNDTMGDDEMLWHLHSVAAQASADQRVCVWDPLVMTSVAKVRQGHLVFSWASLLPSTCTIITAIVLNQHWIPLVWRKEGKQLLGFTGGIPNESLDVVRALHAYVCKMVDVPVSELGLASQLPPSSWCGSVAIQYISHLLSGIPFREVHETPQETHQQLQDRFVAAMGLNCPRPWIWGRGISEHDEQLSALLRQHGVEAAEVPTRMDLLKQKLGQEAIQKSLQSANPWRHLKWYANQCVPQLQLIRPAELESAIERRAGSKAPVGNKNQKKKGSGKGSFSSSQRVNPDSLRLEAGVFQGDGAALEQVQMSQIGPLVSGVVLANVDQALPYLVSGKQVSMGALAVVIMNPPSEGLKVPLISERVKFPVVCAANAEPLIVEGDMYQLGSKPVGKQVFSKPVMVKTIENCVFKVVAFKDGFGEGWPNVISHPIQMLLSKLPILVKCSVEGTCDCPKWHPDPMVGVNDPILELWNRQWLTTNYTQVRPGDADLFSVTIRVPKAVESVLLQVPGQEGVCVEPRSMDGRKPSEDFFVVWMPKLSASQALVMKQTTAKVLGLARLGSKWGLRCRMADAGEVHRTVRPDSEFLPVGQKQLFLVGPLPFGALRQSLVDAFREMEWAARPLHALPAARNVQGVMWKVQATSSPPKSVLQLQDGEAVIARFTQIHSETVRHSPVIGTQDTVKICSTPNSEKKESDPWLHQDPWGSYKPSTSAPTAGSSAVSATGDAVAGLEQRVLDAVLAKLPRDDMDIDSSTATEGRFQALEQQVHWLADQHNKLQSSLQEQGAVQQAQVSQLQAQFQAQHAQLESAVQQQSHQISGLSSSFQAQLDKQGNKLDDMFSLQMARMEELLGAKKPRRDVTS